MDTARQRDLWIMSCALAACLGCGDEAKPHTPPFGSGARTSAGASGASSGTGVTGDPTQSTGDPLGATTTSPATTGSGSSTTAPARMDAGGSSSTLPDASGTHMDAGGMSGDASAGGPATSACDRTCLLAIMQGYIDALMANDPSTLKVSTDLKYTENGEASELGETVWQTASALIPEARLDFADPQEGQVASQFAFHESGSTPVIYQVRLKVEEGEITEIESMAVRRRGAANGFFNVDNMVPEPVFMQEVDPAQRNTREELLEITHLYLDYLEGSKEGDELPFHDDCKRYENGQVTASGVRTFEQQSFWSFDVTRRILIVDEEAGITWGMFPFEQTDTALVVGEAFKIFGGEIRMIQAVMADQPTNFWD